MNHGKDVILNTILAYLAILSYAELSEMFIYDVVLT